MQVRTGSNFLVAIMLIFRALGCEVLPLTGGIKKNVTLRTFIYKTSELLSIYVCSRLMDGHRQLTTGEIIYGLWMVSNWVDVS
jgi:hypothetical protein